MEAYSKCVYLVHVSMLSVMPQGERSRNSSKAGRVSGRDCVDGCCEVHAAGVEKLELRAAAGADLSACTVVALNLGCNSQFFLEEPWESTAAATMVGSNS